MTEEEIKAMAEENKSLKALMEESKSKLEKFDYLEAEFKKSIEARDKAKEERRKAEEKRLADNNEFKTLSEQRALEVEKLAEERKALDEAKKSLEDNLNKYLERDKAKLKTLLDKLPEEKKALIKESYELEDRLELAESFVADSQKAAPGYRPPGGGNVPTKEERIKNAKTHQELEAILAET